MGNKKIYIFIIVNLILTVTIFKGIGYLNELKTRVNKELGGKTLMLTEISNLKIYKGLIDVYSGTTNTLRGALKFSKTVDALIYITEILSKLNIKPLEMNQKEVKKEGIINLKIKGNYKKLFGVLKAFTGSDKLLKLKNIYVEKDKNSLKMNLEIRVNLKDEK